MAKQGLARIIEATQAIGPTRHLDDFAEKADRYMAAGLDGLSQELPALLSEVRRTGTPFVAQEREVRLARHQPGEPAYFNFVYQPLFDDNGRVTAVVIVATDVAD